MRNSNIAVSVIFLVILCSVPLASSQGEGSVARSIIVEPSYQIYTDEFVLAQGTGNYTFSFFLPSSLTVYSVKAYDQGNQSLVAGTSFNSTTKIYSINIQSSNLQRFFVQTIIHGMTIQGNNYTTALNLFPIAGEALQATTRIYVPEGAQLLSYSQNFSQSTVDGRTVLSGSKQLEPGNASTGNIVYNGTYSLVEVQYLDRVITIKPSSVLFQENIKLTNFGNNQIGSVILNTPENATDITVTDTIGYMGFENNGTTMKVTLRAAISSLQNASFTINYAMPASGAIQMVDGRSVFSSEMLPEWCNFLADQVSMTIIMPPGSSGAEFEGGTVVDDRGVLKGVANATSITPYENQVVRLSYVASPYAGMTGPAILIGIVAALIVVAVLMIKFGRKKKPEAAAPIPAATAAPASPPKPATTPSKPKKGQPQPKSKPKK